MARSSDWIAACAGVSSRQAGREATTMRCRVLIWSTKPAFVRAMRSLAYREGLEIVAIAGSAEAAVAARAHRPDVVLVDRATEEAHPDTVVRLAAEGPGTKVVAVDLVDEAAVVLEGRRATAATIRELVQVIRGGLASQAA
jgi:AmiR/NasT family two-component response regulator